MPTAVMMSNSRHWKLLNRKDYIAFATAVIAAHDPNANSDTCILKAVALADGLEKHGQAQWLGRAQRNADTNEHIVPPAPPTS